jgi:hypothetical protein
MIDLSPRTGVLFAIDAQTGRWGEEASEDNRASSGGTDDEDMRHGRHRRERVTRVIFVDDRGWHSVVVMNPSGLINL